MRVCIVDNERPAREELKYLLGRIGDVEIVGEASGGAACLEESERLHPDVVFLDIRMEGPPGSLDGLEVARLLQQSPRKPLIIFVTAYEEYAVKAINSVGPLGYILKPFSESSLREMVMKVKAFLPPASKQVLIDFYGPDNMTICPQISFRTIAFFHCRNEEVLGYSGDGTYKVKLKMYELEDLLSDCDFFRSHRNYLVNLNHIAEYKPWLHDSCLLTMDDKKKSKVPVSRYKTKGFLNAFSVFKHNHSPR